MTALERSVGVDLEASLEMARDANRHEALI